MERLLVERMPLRGICRPVDIGLKWLFGVLIHGVEAFLDHLNGQPITPHQDVMIPGFEADDMLSVVKQQVHTPWMCLSMDAKTRPVMAFHIGDCRRKRAKPLGAKIPLGDRQHAIFDSDQSVVSVEVILAA